MIDNVDAYHRLELYAGLEINAGLSGRRVKPFPLGYDVNATAKLS